MPQVNPDEMDDLFRDLLPDDAEPAMEPTPTKARPQTLAQQRAEMGRAETNLFRPERAAVSASSSKSTPYQRSIDLNADTLTFEDLPNTWTQNGEYFERVNLAN